jgi:hypothetical protein
VLANLSGWFLFFGLGFGFGYFIFLRRLGDRFRSSGHGDTWFRFLDFRLGKRFGGPGFTFHHQNFFLLEESNETMAARRSIFLLFFLFVSQVTTFFPSRFRESAVFTHR